ncbi:MAG: PAS domain S-box protein [Thermodesulfobacteriota bacterium]
MTDIPAPDALASRLAALEAEAGACRLDEAAMRRHTGELVKRIRELQCLYGISQLVEQPGISLTEILAGVARLLPCAGQYPEIAWGRVVLDGTSYCSHVCDVHGQHLSQPLLVQGRPAGLVQLGYREEPPPRAGGPFWDEERQLLAAIAERCGRIVERKRAEDKLLKLSHAMEHSPSAILITDHQGRIEYANPKLCAITGYQEEEVLGHNAAELGSQGAAAAKELWATILAGHEWRGEFHNLRKDGSPYWESASISAIRDAKGAITHFVKVAEDITELKKVQDVLQANEERHHQDERRLDLLRFANQVAQDLMHELRNPLVSIGGFARLIATRDTPADKMVEYSRIIFEQATRLEAALNKALAHLQEAAAEG